MPSMNIAHVRALNVDLPPIGYRAELDPSGQIRIIDVANDQTVILCDTPHAASCWHRGYIRAFEDASRTEASRAEA